MSPLRGADLKLALLWCAGCKRITDHKKIHGVDRYECECGTKRYAYTRLSEFDMGYTKRKGTGWAGRCSRNGF